LTLSGDEILGDAHVERKFLEMPMWEAVIAGTAILTIAGSTFAFAQQPSPAEKPLFSPRMI
jgi:hypothetical protein